MSSKIGTKFNYIAMACICAFVLVLYLIFGLFMVPMRIDGASMYPTLENEQVIYVQKPFVSYKLGMVVVFERPDTGYNCIKRIVGLPNDKIRISDGKLYRNGVLADDIYNKSQQYMDILVSNNNMTVVNGEYTLGDDEYFLLGDNRSNSLDSRVYGGVKKDKLIGKALFIKE